MPEIRQISLLIPSDYKEIFSQVRLLANMNKVDIQLYSNTRDFNETFSSLEVPLGDLKIFIAESQMFCDLKDYDFLGPNVQVILIGSQPAKKLPLSKQQLACIRSVVDIVDGKIDPRDFAILIKKFRLDDIFGLDKYLSYGAHLQEMTISSSDDKEVAIQRVLEFVSNLGSANAAERFVHYSRSTAELVDELLLNAVFNANPRFSEDPALRKKKFSLEPAEQVKVIWGYDGEFFGVSVVDPFGCLQRETILSYLLRKQKLEDASKRTSGGMGFQLIFERLHRLVINVTPQKYTEVICLLAFEKRMRDFNKKPRVFHYFTHEEDKAS